MKRCIYIGVTLLQQEETFPPYIKSLFLCIPVAETLPPESRPLFLFIAPYNRRRSPPLAP